MVQKKGKCFKLSKIAVRGPDAIYLSEKSTSIYNSPNNLSIRK